MKFSWLGLFVALLYLFFFFRVLVGQDAAGIFVLTLPSNIFLLMLFGTIAHFLDYSISSYNMSAILYSFAALCNASILYLLGHLIEQFVRERFFDKSTSVTNDQRLQ
jgi:tellurite resistance protein TehA-like permease